MICFAILAHDKEEILMDQIANIRKYNPNSQIVLYNGGSNKKYARNLDIAVCPYSRPLTYGRLERYFLDVMRWLEEIDMKYDYLVSTDSDVLFVNKGYETFLQEYLKEYDCMGVNMIIQRDPNELAHWYPGQTMWKEWKLWQPFFQLNCFCGTLNPMQVYTREIVKKIVSDLDMSYLERLLSSTKVFALEEMLHPTLALRAGGRPRKYPVETAEYTRCGAFINMHEAQAARRSGAVFFVHPVKRDVNDPSRQWISGMGA